MRQPSPVHLNGGRRHIPAEANSATRPQREEDIRIAQMARENARRAAVARRLNGEPDRAAQVSLRLLTSICKDLCRHTWGHMTSGQRRLAMRWLSSAQVTALEAWKKERAKTPDVAARLPLKPPRRVVADEDA